MFRPIRPVVFGLGKPKIDPRAVGPAGGLDQGVEASMTTPNVPRRPVAETLSDVLASPEITRLIDRLQATRWTGRPGYPIRAMVA